MTTVRLFAGLKLRLLAGNLRGDAQRKAGFVFTVIAAVVVAALGFLSMAMLRAASPEIAADLVILAYAGLFFGWAVVPLLAFGLDDTLDPARLALFPLRTRDLAVGMFTASATGVWPAATLIVTAGAVAGLARGPGGLLIGVVAVLLQFALCLVTSRLITTALSGALRSRRGRDLLAVAAILLVLLFQLPNLIGNGGLGDPAALIGGMAAALRWTPPGLAAHAVADGGLAGLAEIAVLALVVLGLGLLWIKALGRALVSTDASTQGAAVRGSGELSDRFLPDGHLAAVVAKELKYIRRDPRFRVGWFSSLVVTAAIAFSVIGQSDGPAGPFMVLGPAALCALMLAVQSCNVFGIDGRSLWMNAVAVGDERGLRIDLAGRHLAAALLGLPLLAAVAVAAALFVGLPETIWSAVLCSWGVFLLGLGAGSVTSVLIPYTVPDRLNAFSGAAPGQGGQAFAGSFGALVAVAALSLPVVLPVALGLTWVAVLAVPYGLGAEYLGRRVAAAIGHNRMPEILTAVSHPT
jgi:ABC-2 type transport system permease protein